MSLPTRKIGNTQVTALGYGAMGISAFYGAVGSDEERLEFLDELYKTGCTFWDTANIYMDSEDLLGKWFKRSGKRQDIFLATKFGMKRKDGRLVVDGSPENVKESFEKSLSRLGVDHVELFYLHRPDNKVPIEVTVGAMAELVSAGKVDYLGLSEVSASTLRRAHAIHPIAALQVEYSVFTLDIEDPDIDLLRTARELGVTVVAYSPLGRGLITGQYRSPDDFEEGDFRRSVPRYSKENFPNILKIADGLKRTGEKYDATAGQVSLAWLLAQGEDVIPIPGTRKLKYLHENLGALKVHLSKEDADEVRVMAKKADATQGPRYPPGAAEMLYQETPAWEK